MKKIVYLFILFFSIFTITACNKNAKIELETSYIELEVGEQYEINPIITKTKKKNVVYEIENGDSVNLENNIIEAKKVGTTIVKVFLKKQPKICAELEINVKEKFIPTLNVSIDKTEIEVEEITNLNITTNVSLDKVKVEVIDNTIIEVNENSVKGLKVGTTKIKVSLIDYSNIYEEVEISVYQIIDEEAPEIILDDETMYNVTLNWGKEFDALKGVTAIDNIDGEITDKIVVQSTLNNKKYGKYEIVYSIRDKAGNETSLTRTVTVIWDYEVGFIGHAGSYYGVMNTEDAFLYAVRDLQYQLVECDVKQTSDGVFVTCHDDTFGDYTLASTSWNTIKDVEVTKSRTSGYPSQYGEKVGSYTSKICTLERYLEICKEYGAIAVVELKSSKGISNTDQSRMQALMNVIEEAGMLNQVIFLGSAYNCLIWVKENGYEYIPCQYLVNSCESDTILNRCIEYGLDVSINVTGGYSNSEEWISKYQDAGLKVSTYTYTQWIDYKEVQEWIDKGIDYVTCDWHRMDEFNLPDRADAVYYNVIFKDSDGTILKETKVKQGRAAAAPSVNAPIGYKFVGWDKEIKNISKDMEVFAKYELIEYNIQYDSNLYVMTEQSWENKEEFVTEFYNDLFTWVTENIDSINGLTHNNGKYTFTINSTEYGTSSFTSATDIKGLYVYNFERTLATLIFKPINGSNSQDYVPEVDNHYFLNTEPYRSKYINFNAYFYNAMKTGYTSYSTEYNQASNNRVQIFFRFHQWANGSNISVFDKYPTKYAIRYMTGVDVVMPTNPLKYTYVDEMELPKPITSVEFLGWYLDRECTGDPITKIFKGSTGDITLYAKWGNVEIEEIYSEIIYNLNGGENNPQNKETYLEGISHSLYEPIKLGYKFKGWSKDVDGNEYIVMISEKTSGTINLYANWEPMVYKINYNIGEGTWGNEVKFEGDAVTNIDTHANSNFWGNYANSVFLYEGSNYNSTLNAQYSYRVGLEYDSVTKLYKVASISTSGNASFDYTNKAYIIMISGSYANYGSTSSFRNAVEIGQYVTISGTPENGNAHLEFFNKESVSGGIIENYVEEYTIESNNLILPTPKLEGKRFVGWSLNSDLSGEVYTILPLGLTGDITLYAVYE